MAKPFYERKNAEDKGTEGQLTNKKTKNIKHGTKHHSWMFIAKKKENIKSFKSFEKKENKDRGTINS